jgi:hypothetical protein
MLKRDLHNRRLEEFFKEENPKKNLPKNSLPPPGLNKKNMR